MGKSGGLFALGFSESEERSDEDDQDGLGYESFGAGHSTAGESTDEVDLAEDHSLTEDKFTQCLTEAINTRIRVRIKSTSSTSRSSGEEPVIPNCFILDEEGLFALSFVMHRFFFVRTDSFDKHSEYVDVAESLSKSQGLLWQEKKPEKPVDASKSLVNEKELKDPVQVLKSLVERLRMVFDKLTNEHIDDSDRATLKANIEFVESHLDFIINRNQHSPIPTHPPSPEQKKPQRKVKSNILFDADLEAESLRDLVQSVVEAVENRCIAYVEEYIEMKISGRSCSFFSTMSARCNANNFLQDTLRYSECEKIDIERGFDLRQSLISYLAAMHAFITNNTPLTGVPLRRHSLVTFQLNLIEDLYRSALKLQQTPWQGALLEEVARKLRENPVKAWEGETLLSIKSHETTPLILRFGSP